jgi:hypothetical protein
MAIIKLPTHYPDGRQIETDGSIHIDYAHKHSPAPWRIVYNDIIYDANDNIVVEYYRLATNPSDAALIAAAPELLAACKLALERDLEQVDNVGFGAIGESGRKILLAAIAAAERTETTETK